MGIFSLPAQPTVKEADLPNLSGKVYIVTGSTSGVGKELAQILYSRNAKIYVAARSESKAKDTINAIKRSHPHSKGSLVYLHLELSDLSTIRASAADYLSQEEQLHVLWNNAGVMMPPQGSVTKQNYELQIGTNNLGHFLFTKLLTPILQKTAKVSPPCSVRVVWVSSSAASLFSPHGGVDMSNLDYKHERKPWHKYGVSKAGSILYCREFARLYGNDGIISISCDPGNLKTDLYRDSPRLLMSLANLALHDPIYGAYTELYCGFSGDLTEEENGTFIRPWGKIGSLRKDIEASTKSKAEKGTGLGTEFWDWSEKQVAPFTE